MENDDHTPPNLLKDHKFARTLLKKTTRGKNPDWYREAVQLDHQLHLFESVNGFLSFFLDVSAGEPTKLNPLPDENEATLITYFEYLKSEVLPEKSRGLGVILHLNHDASVFEFPRQDWEVTHPGTSLRELLASDPAEVLQDRTLSESELAFRVFPTPAHPKVEESNCAIAASARGVDLLAAFRAWGAESDYPVRTHGLSSPLLLIARLPRLSGVRQEPFAVLLRYDSFSFVGFFEPTGELILLRSIKHQGETLPHNLESILTTTAASIELPGLMVEAYDCRLRKSVPLEAELTPLLLSVPFEVRDSSSRSAGVSPESSESHAAVVQTSDLPIELQAYLIADDDTDLAFAETETFGSNLTEGYHLQNFLEVPQAERDALPGALDMKLLRIGRLVTRVGLAACLLLGLFVGFSMLSKTRSEEWKSAKGAQVQAAIAAKQLAEAKATERLLADRSKGWVAMEVFSQLFPLDGSFQFESARYEVTADQARGAASAVGMTRSWDVTGLARENTTRALLQRDSTEGMNAIFKQAEVATDNASLDVDPKSRNLAVDLNFSDNRNFQAGAQRGSAESFAYTFSLAIDQRIGPADSLAIPLTKL